MKKQTNKTNNSKITIIALILLIVCTSGILFIVFNDIFVQSPLDTTEDENTSHIVTQDHDEAFQPLTSENNVIGTDAQYETSMFSWSREVFLNNQSFTFLGVMEYLGIDRIYQSMIPQDLQTDEFKQFMKILNQQDMEVYYLCGDRSWGVEPNATTLLNEISIADTYNKSVEEEYRFKGVHIDVEPFLTDEWDEDEYATMDQFVENMKAAYDYAKECGFEVVISLPYWFDNNHIEDLEYLIAECSDVVSIMNYNKTDETEQMKNETELAQKHGKEIECIYEYQAVGVYELKEIETYANDGLQASLDSFANVYNNFQDEELDFSYHYYNSVYDMLLQNK